MTTTTEPGLCERKRAETEAALVRAAYDLAEGGIGAVTAEAIAERAGVSRRTFFNYFPSIDAACAHSVELLLAELTETLSRRPADECLWDTMEALLAGEAGSPVIERLALLAATKENSPVARHLAHDHIDAFVEWLTGWLMDRLGPDVDEVYAATLAASVVATAEATVHIWQRRHGGATTPDALAAYHDLLTTSMARLRTGFDTPPAR